MVAPFPSSEEENANLYMYKASVVDATPGPPQVVIKACSKDFRHPVKQKIKQISSTGLIWGKTICQASCLLFTPSIRALQ